MANNEALAFDGLALNDEISFAIEGSSFKFTPAQKRPQWIDNPDADGSALAFEPNYTNSEFSFSVRIVPQVNMDTALAKWGELQAKLQKASQYRDKGGIPLVWTPAGSTKTYTWYVLLGEISEIPITAQGDLAGWFINSPVISVKLTCRPFGYLEERTVLVEKTNATPLQEQVIEGVGGDVPAEGRMIITEKSAVDRRHLEWGLDQNSGTLLLTAAAGLTTTGFTGTVTTRVGAYSAEKVVRATAVTYFATMCSTGNISNIGSYRIKLRVFVTSAAARFRVTYRVGDGPFKTLPSVTPPLVNQWVEIDCGEVTLEEVLAGTQRAEIRVETKSVGAVTEVDVNYAQEIPTAAGYGKARGIQSNEASQLLAYDEFAKATAGNLDTPKALEFGGNWSEAVKTGGNGFQVDATNDVAVRTAVSDADLLSGSYAIAGSTSYSAVSVSASVQTSANENAGLEKTRLGVFARYINAENWLMCVIETTGKKERLLRVLKRVSGTVTVLGGVQLPGGPVAPIPLSALNLYVAVDGTWRASNYSSTAAPLQGQDADLATGGTLANGKVGFYDAWTSATANTRTVDNFIVLAAAAAGRVCYAGKKAEVRADSTGRQDATGTYYGSPSSYRGSRLYLPVGNSRVALKLRRNDTDTEPDSAVTDSQGIEVRAAERVLAPR